MEKSRYKTSFKKKIILIISAFSGCLVILVTILNYKWNAAQLTEQTLNQTRQIIEQLSVNLDTYFDELTRLTLAPYYSSEVMTLLGNESATDQLTRKRVIETYLASAMTLPRDEMLRVYVLTDSDIYSYIRTPYDMNDYDSYLTSDWYLESLSTTRPVLIPVHFECAYGHERTQIISVARQIRSLSSNNRTLGVIKLDADYTGIKNICDKISFESKGALYIIGNEGDIVYSRSEFDDPTLLNSIDFSDKNSSFETEINGEKYYITLMRSETSSLKAIAINSYSEITKKTRNNLQRTLILSTLCLLFSTVFFIFFIDRSFHPLFRIISSMQEVQSGNLKVHVPVTKNDEIGYLAASYNEMILHLQQTMDENTNLIKDIYSARYLQKESQYHALCNQIKPHFFYNTLNTISLLIKCDEKEKAISSIDNFSRFLRGVMNADKEISLETELQIIRAYLSVIKLRYDDKITFEITAEEHMLSLSIPALLIQPIVENAVKHGCECKRGNSLIKIDAVSFGSFCKITVTDDGVGMPPDILEKLRCSTRKNTLQSQQKCDIFEEHIGMINVYNRLLLKYGDSAGFSIDSSSGKGTCITITIPILEEEGGKEDVSCIDCR